MRKISMIAVAAILCCAIIGGSIVSVVAGDSKAFNESCGLVMCVLILIALFGWPIEN